MAGANKICQNIPALQGRIDALKTLADGFEESSTFGGSADDWAMAEAECKGTAYAGICENDAQAHQALDAMRAMVDSFQTFVNADILTFTKADNA